MFVLTKKSPQRNSDKSFIDAQKFIKTCKNNNRSYKKQINDALKEGLL